MEKIYINLFRKVYIQWVLGVTDESDLKITKVEMANPIWYKISENVI